MKLDCPHCNKSMRGKFVRWRKFASENDFRNCRLCGAEIEFLIYPEELAARLFTIAVVIAGAYWAKERGGGYLMILVTVALVLLAAYGAMQWRLRDRQRYKKGRNSPD